MKPPARIAINEALWVRGESISTTQRNGISETKALTARGAKIFLLKSARDQDGLARLKKILWQSDVHVILSWLQPAELNALLPLLRERKNFSLLNDDWWLQPYWFMREAEYLMFRKYHGIAVRLGLSEFLSGGQPPWLLDPRPDLASYTLFGALLRPAALAVSPVMELWQHWQRRGEVINPKRLVYFPFAIDPANVPLSQEKPQYDFSNTGGTCGIWLMRDAYAPFHHSFANLYADRKRLTDAIAAHAGNPFTFYDCRNFRKNSAQISYAEYLQKNQQSRFLIASGGLHDSTVPKFLEYACVGTPMIGRGLPFDYPWLDDCLFPVEMLAARPENIKPLLHQALEAYPKLRENCLNWRDRLLQLYSLENLLDLLQAQIDGQAIPADYLKNPVRATGLSETH